MTDRVSLLITAADRLLDLCDEHTSGTMQLARDVRQLATELALEDTTAIETLGAELSGAPSPRPGALESSDSDPDAAGGEFIAAEAR